MIGFSFDTLSKNALKKAETYPPLCVKHKEELTKLGTEIIGCQTCVQNFAVFYRELLKAYPILSMILPDLNSLIQIINKQKEKQNA